MDSARADAIAARSHLDSHGWIPRRSESFRHLLPPPAAVWLGEAAGTDATSRQALPLEGGWTLHAPHANVQARWLDAADPGQRAELFAGLPLAGDDDAAPFAWAHRALVRQGLRLRIGASAGDQGTAWLRLSRHPGAAVEAPLLVIELAAGARCVLVETHDGAAQEGGDPQPGMVQNLQVHIHLAEGASLTHLRIVTPAAGNRVAHLVQVRLGADARYDQCLLAAGSTYHLQRNVLDLHGSRAAARTSSVLLAAGSAIELQAQLRHAAAHTHSAVDALALGSGAARMVVNAHTRIDAGCDEAQVRQRLAGIPTGGQPRLVLRPHLEIHHDQVQAAHGATWGALPEEALFHARQRGLDQRSAQAMIVEGMARAVLARSLDRPELLDTLGMAAILAQAVARHLAAGTDPGQGGSHG